MGGFFRAVGPMSLSEIEAAADHLRKLLLLDSRARVQMVNLIETVLDEILPDYLFCVLPDEDMPGMDGVTAIGSFTICLSEHTYIELCQSNPEARMTAAHELGHLILHSHQQPALARRSFNNESVDPEWQADRFAEFWLMPTAGVAECSSADEVARRFTVPLVVARRRFDQIRKEAQGDLFE